MTVKSLKFSVSPFPHFLNGLIKAATSALQTKAVGHVTKCHQRKVTTLRVGRLREGAGGGSGPLSCSENLSSDPWQTRLTNPLPQGSDHPASTVTVRPLDLILT